MYAVVLLLGLLHVEPGVVATGSSAVDGFQRLRFGMNRDEIKSAYSAAWVAEESAKIYPGALKDGAETGNMFARAETTTDIKGDKLWRITVTFSVDAADLKSFVRLRDALQHKYGRPDEQKVELERAAAVWRRDPASILLEVGNSNSDSPAEMYLRYQSQTFAPDGYALQEIPSYFGKPVPAPRQLLEPRKLKKASLGVNVWDTTFTRESDDYDRSYIRLCFHFENLTTTRIIGVLTRVDIKNAFGRVILQTTHENEVSLAPGERLRNDTCWIYKDNPFIQGEPYDLMWKAAVDGTGRVAVSVKKIVFEDGIVVAR